jgi:nucleotide-binding universal stress UspA family protein
LLVPARVAARRSEVRYRRIVVPLDGSSRAESVIPVATRLAEGQGAELVFVHVVPKPEIFRAGPLDQEAMDLEQRAIEHNRRKASAYLERLRGRFGSARCRVRIEVEREGSARTKLDRLIREERPDLVVMSAHGTTGHLDSSCGCVTDYALTHATAPLLVLRDREARRMRRVEPGAARSAETAPPLGPRAS